MRHLTPQKPLRERERETDTDGHGQQQVSKRRADGFACAAYSGHHGWGEKHTKHGSFTPRASSSTESHSAILDGGTDGGTEAEAAPANFMSGQIQRRFMASYPILLTTLPRGEPRARPFSNRRL